MAVVRAEARPHILYDSIKPGASAISANTSTAIFGNERSDDGESITNLVNKYQLPQNYQFWLFGISWSLSPLVPTLLEKAIGGNIKFTLKIQDKIVFEGLLEDILQSSKLEIQGTTTADTAAFGTLKQAGDGSKPYTPVGYWRNGKLEPIVISGNVKFEGEIKYLSAIDASTFAATDLLRIKLHGILFEPAGM